MNVVAEISSTHRTKYSWLFLSSLTCCISVLCKEQGVTALVRMECLSCQITPVPLYSKWSFQLHSSSFCQGHRSAFCLSVSVSLSYYPPFYPFILSLHLSLSLASYLYLSLCLCLSLSLSLSLHLFVCLSLILCLLIDIHPTLLAGCVQCLRYPLCVQSGFTTVTQGMPDTVTHWAWAAGEQLTYSTQNPGLKWTLVISVWHSSCMLRT